MLFLNSLGTPNVNTHPNYQQASSSCLWSEIFFNEWRLRHVLSSGFRFQGLKRQRQKSECSVLVYPENTYLQIPENWKSTLMTVIGSTCTCAIICNASFYTLKHWRIICNLNHVKLLQPFFTTYTINTRLYTIFTFESCSSSNLLNKIESRMPSLETLCFPISLWLVKISGNEGAGRGEVIRSFRKSTKPYRLADSPVSRPGPFLALGVAMFFLDEK